MSKQADIQHVSDQLRGWYQGIDPEVRGAMLRGLAGAAVGAGAAGGLAAATPHDPADRRSVVSPALLGALLGGGAASLLPVGAKLLSGHIHLAAEPRRPAGAKVTEALLDPLASHPLAIGGALAATYHAREPLGTLVRGVRAQPSGNIASRLAGVLGDREHWDLATKGLQRGHGLAAAELAKIPRAFTHAGSRARLLAIPAALAAGAIGDKYLKGEY